MLYQQLEDNESNALFEYQLAEHLRMTVTELRQMPNREFVGWQAYLMRKEQKAQIATPGR